MKIVLNKRFGSFGLCNVAEDILGVNSYDVERTDKRLIELIEEKGADLVQGSMSKLKIVEVPDEATDWELNDYDGIETITYVVDGKLHHV